MRLADPGDARLLAGLGASLFEQTFGARNRSEDMRAYLAGAFSEARQERELLDPAMRSWIAEDDQEAIGYAQLHLGSAPTSLSLERPSELARIYTDARFHGRGVGGLLLANVLGAARDWSSTHIWLGVWKENPRGIAFYEKHGFRIAAEQTFQLGNDTQSDWIMVRDLRQAVAGR